MSSNTLLQQAQALRLKKQLSQNFLIDPKAVEAIVNAASPEGNTHPIIEIGPGAGFLTESLLNKGQTVYAIEVDDTMIKHLTQRFGENPAFHLIHQSVLDVNLNQVCQGTCRVVGNLPYHLTGPILFQLAGELRQINHEFRQSMVSAVVMVQKEVGERILAKPGDTQYSQLTLQLACWFEARRVLNVPKKAFHPSPKVDSMVIELTPRATPAVIVKDYDLLQQLIKRCFLHRRKTVWNNLKLTHWLEETPLRALLSDLNIDPSSRAQSLSLEAYGALCDAFSNHGISPRQN